MTDPNCWTWDGYLGECVRRHKPPWWDYLNVWSVSAVIIVITYCLLFVVAAVYYEKGRIGRGES